MNIIAIIPARMGSSRYPGKPLALIHNVPMVGHVAFRTAMSPILSETYVATCDPIIEDYCKKVGIKCVMTSDSHVRCSTRTAEALLKIERETGKKADIVVMVQGDEPMVRPEMIDASVKPLLEDQSVNVVNLMAEMDTLEEFEDPNEVKVVVDCNSDALYFSREPIPSRKKGSDRVPMRKQVCVIPFRRDTCCILMKCPKARLKFMKAWICSGFWNTVEKCAWLQPVVAHGALIHQMIWPGLSV